MTPLLTINLLRVLFVTFCAVIGANISSALIGNLWPGLLLGLVLGLVVVLIDRLLKGVSLRLFSSATFGLLLGLIFANLLMASQVLRYQSETMQWSVRLIVYAVFGYLGMMLAMRSSRDEFSLIIPYVRFARETTQHEPLVVDTNVIIDGRISDLCATGFLSRSLIVNHARAHVGKTRTVVVASALQTTAGRLIFAELKNGAAQASVSREPV
jgi:uncharacterized protein YacL